MLTSRLVTCAGDGVSNLSASTTSERRGGNTQIPGIDESDPLYDFFRRFIPRQPGPNQGPNQGPQQQPQPPAQGPRSFEQRSLGSGFIVSPDGYVLTNAHVVNNADEITVKLNDKREFKARVIGADARTDLAVLKIDAGREPLPSLQFGDSDRVQVGDLVLAIGDPFGVGQTVTLGIVSALARTLPEVSYTYATVGGPTGDVDEGSIYVRLTPKATRARTGKFVAEKNGSASRNALMPTARAR